MNKYFALLLLAFPAHYSEAQNRKNTHALPPVAPQDTVPAQISMDRIAGGMVQFSAKLRPLRQVAGAPAPFYTYFWEFGDGTFSDITLNEGKSPKHQYKKSGTYQVRLFATNNYDYGLAPPAKPHVFTVQVNAPSSARWNSNFFRPGDKNIKIKVNRNPRPGEELVAYVGYRNRTGSDFAGSLVLFFNEKRFYQKTFSLVNRRTYYGEESSSLDRMLSQSMNPEVYNVDMLAGRNSDELSTQSQSKMLASAKPVDRLEDKADHYVNESRVMIQTLKKDYMEHTVLRFNSLPRGEERFAFLTLRTLQEMIKETDDAIKMTALLVPDNPSLPVEMHELYIPIVASHDPNQMVLKQGRLNYRFMGKKKELNYKVQFQNYGTGPARNVSIAIALPKQLNAASLQLTGVSPGLIPCDLASYSQQSCMDTIRTADSIYILFKNIYLPGTKQNLVKNEDSTKGYVEYTIRFHKKPPKKPFSSRAVIIFDNNKPVYTNKATAKFIKGISPGIMVGYNMFLSSGSYTATGPLQIGYVLAPFSPHRPYFQLELHGGFRQIEDSTGTSLFTTGRWKYPPEVIKPVSNLNSFRYDTVTSRKETTVSKMRHVIQVVPLHFRYNINNWIGVGVGMLGQIAVSEKTTVTEKYYLAGTYFTQTPQAPNGTRVPFATDATYATSSTKKWTDARFVPFFDLQVGRVRTGPTLGIRYIRQLEGTVRNRFFMYAAFKL